MTADFYARLPAVERFERLADADAYAPLPDDWTVVLTDVVGSTEAVRAGRYRDVNYAGAASIAAVLNASGRADLPFAFGGDGATLVVPPAHLGAGLAALSALRAHAAERLGLELRVGAVPLADVRAAGCEIAVARFRASEAYAQALFWGDGMAWAEQQVKDPATAARYRSEADPIEAEGDPYEGLECRWQDVRSPGGETVSLLVEAVGADPGATYREVLHAIGEAYPTDAAHPVSLDRLRLARSPAELGSEARLRRPKVRRWAQVQLWGLTLVGRALMRLGIRTGETDWGRYRSLVRSAADVRKFDGVLRMVLAGSPDQRHQLEEALERMHAAGRLAYGLHVSDRAVLTCLVYERMGRQVHFVDGAGGGYTNAAVGFKRRRAALTG